MSKLEDSYNQGYQQACKDNFPNPYNIHTQNALYTEYNRGYAYSVALMAQCTAAPTSAPTKGKS